MVPHKTQRGAKALERVKTFEGVPPPYDKTKRMVVPQCLKIACLQHGHRYCRLADLSTQVRTRARWLSTWGPCLLVGRASCEWLEAFCGGDSAPEPPVLFMRAPSARQAEWRIRLGGSAALHVRAWMRRCCCRQSPQSGLFN